MFGQLGYCRSPWFMPLRSKRLINIRICILTMVMRGQKEMNDAAGNEDELRAAGAQFQMAVAEHLPIIPLLNRNSIYINRKTVHGYLPHQWNLYPYYNDVWLE